MALPSFDDLFDWIANQPACTPPHVNAISWTKKNDGEPSRNVFDTSIYRQVLNNPLVATEMTRGARRSSKEDRIILAIPALQSVASGTHVMVTRGSWKKFHVTSYYPNGEIVNTQTGRVVPGSGQLPAGYQPYLSNECASWWRLSVVEGTLRCVSSDVRQSRPACEEFRVQEHFGYFLQLLHQFPA